MQAPESRWYFTAMRGLSGRWVGLAKREPFVNGHPIYEPGDVWFEFGDTRDEAIANVKQSVLH